MKKKKPEVVMWDDLKVGDFVESNDAYLFCFSTNNILGAPSCLGKQKPKINNLNAKYHQQWFLYGDFKRLNNPTKAFVKLCKKLLKENLDNGSVDNLSYVEALTALKKYD